MTRHLVLSNSSLLVGLDGKAQVRDFYFPYIGQENHVSGQEHKIGFWIDGKFSWFSDWKKTITYLPETLVSNVTGSKEGLNVTFNDAVLHDKNIFLRKLTCINQGKTEKKIKIFFHQQFEISEANIGDTVYWNPEVKSLIHYKGQRYFLMNGSEKIAEFATGLVGEYGREGTYKDAEDGVLSNNPIEHGSVDSALAFHITLPANGKKELFYWICVGKKYQEVALLNDYIKNTGAEKLIQKTTLYWNKWVNKTKFEFPGLKQEVVDLFKRSLLIINTHVDKEGAIIASSDSDLLFLRKDTYNYMWPRDGALIARSLDRAGYSDITENFFKFCKRVITKDGYLFHKYRPDGSLGSSWHSWLLHGHLQLPIQEDQLALVLDALWKHFQQHGDQNFAKKLFPTFIQPAGKFMLSFLEKSTGLPKESYDLWEEKLGVHTYTACTVFAGFNSLAKFEEKFGTKKQASIYKKAAINVKNGILTNLWNSNKGYFIKMITSELKQDTTLDISSFYGIFEFNVLDVNDPKIESMFKAIQSLKINEGYARYTNDNYHRVDPSTPGNPWIITTLWLAEYYIKKAKNEKDLQPAIKIFEWVVYHALDSGILPEQIHPHTGYAVSVAPLTWSHAGFVIAINKYLEKLDQLGICKMCNPPKIK